MTVQDIIDENERRKLRNSMVYNPYIGTPYCDEIQRQEVYIFDFPKFERMKTQFLPIELLHEPFINDIVFSHSFEKTSMKLYNRYSNGLEKNMLRLFLQLRCKYDFEFWCAWQIKISYKGEGRKGAFILNRAQRYYLSFLEKLRKANKPIDIILLKARQWGGSTMTQMYMLWIQLFHRTQWNSVICGDIEQQSRIVNNMIRSALRTYNPFINNGNPIKLNVFNKTTGILELTERQCTISIGSAQKPDKLRSENISMCHLTEVGLWKKTLGRAPEDLIQTITGSMLSGPYTVMILESTAKGVGNFFHNTWLAAWNGTNNFTPVFVPWFYIATDELPINEPLPSFIQSLTEYEKYLFQLGATLEGIHWYRIKNASIDPYRMKSEFPSTPEEAFQSTGRPYFQKKYIQEQYANCTEPQKIGDIHGFTLGGKECLNNLRFDADEHGCLKMWKDVDTKEPMNDRYLVTVDLGKGLSVSADNSIICVWDRFYQQKNEGGYPEVIAEWCGHNEIDLIAWKAAQIAKYYDNALLVIESNTIESSKEERFRACLEVIKNFYPNIWKRSVRNNGDIGNAPTQFRYGFWTSHQSKMTICSELNTALREGLYIERNKEALHEMEVFEYKPDGSLGAVEGNHDDRVITRALGIHFCQYKMFLPTYKNEKATKSININIL